jgi:hypothetical protein
MLLTINEVRVMKKETESKILEIIKEFTKVTSVGVMSIDLFTAIEMFGNGKPISVTLQTFIV